MTTAARADLHEFETSLLGDSTSIAADGPVVQFEHKGRVEQIALFGFITIPFLALLAAAQPALGPGARHFATKAEARAIVVAGILGGATIGVTIAYLLYRSRDLLVGPWPAPLRNRNRRQRHVVDRVVRDLGDLGRARGRATVLLERIRLEGRGPARHRTSHGSAHALKSYTRGWRRRGDAAQQSGWACRWPISRRCARCSRMS